MVNGVFLSLTVAPGPNHSKYFPNGLMQKNVHKNGNICVKLTAGRRGLKAGDAVTRGV